MKVMRVTWYNPQDLSPLTAVFSLNENEDGEAIRDEEISQAERNGFFGIATLEEVEADDLHETLVQQIVISRWLEERAEAEKNMAMLYVYDANMFAFSRDGGVISTSKPTPLERSDIAYVLLRLAKHPAYRGQTIIAHTREMEAVLMRNGQIQGEGD